MEEVAQERVKSSGDGTNGETEVKHGETFRVVSASIPEGRAWRRNFGLRIADCGFTERRFIGSGFAGALALSAVEKILKSGKSRT